MKSEEAKAIKAQRAKSTKHLAILTDQSPQWARFAQAMQELPTDGCIGTLDHTRLCLAELKGIDICRTLKNFEFYGGYCDCEVIFNVILRDDAHFPMKNWLDIFANPKAA